MIDYDATVVERLRKPARQPNFRWERSRNDRFAGMTRNRQVEEERTGSSGSAGPASATAAGLGFQSELKHSVRRFAVVAVRLRGTRPTRARRYGAMGH
jgi:hypothetical protein